MGNCGELWVIMGNSGELWGCMVNYGILWGCMGNYGVLWGIMGECLPGALTIPTSAPDLPSHGEAPQVDHIALHTFPTKHVAK